MALRFPEERTTFGDLLAVMRRLRNPGGCPWDREQTHRSLLKYLREESDEVCHAVESGDPENLAEELGDVLLQVLFHAQIAEEAGDFDMEDVLSVLRHKLIKRHPHVFAGSNGELLTSDDVKARWNDLKEEEKKSRASWRRNQS